ncbi:MAG: hypothetical protein M0Z31_06070 [Clostridia bacterium]|nr:hypothetical protein [Clostridia bacterium]
MKYKLGVVISFILTLWMVIQFWPNYVDNMFPLFTDMTTIFLFLPAYFILSIGIVGHTFHVLIRNKIIKKILTALVFVASLLYSLSLIDFSIAVKLFVYSVSIGLGFTYLALTNVFAKNSKTFD